ncbi:hypothetical protein MMPV_008190 [Pyropia vietnamensis]
MDGIAPVPSSLTYEAEEAAALALPSVAPPLPSVPSLLYSLEAQAAVETLTPPPLPAYQSETPRPVSPPSPPRKGPLRSHTPIALCEASFTTTESDRRLSARRESAASADLECRVADGGRPRRQSHADSAASSGSTEGNTQLGQVTPSGTKPAVASVTMDAEVAVTVAGAAPVVDPMGQPHAVESSASDVPFGAAGGQVPTLDHPTATAIAERQPRLSAAHGGAAASRRLPKGRVFVSRAGARGPLLLSETPHAAADVTLPMVASRHVSSHLLRRVASSRHGRRLMPSVSSSLRGLGATGEAPSQAVEATLSLETREGVLRPDPAGVDALAKVYEGAILQLAAAAAADAPPSLPARSRWPVLWGGRGRQSPNRDISTPGKPGECGGALHGRPRTGAHSRRSVDQPVSAAASLGSSRRTSPRSDPMAVGRRGGEPEESVDFAMDDFISFLAAANTSRTPWLLRWTSRSRREKRARASTAAASAQQPQFKTISAARAAAAAAAAASAANGGDCPGALGAGVESSSAVKRGLRVLGRPFTRRP